MIVPFSFLEPEVAGALGDDTVIERSAHPPRVSSLHYVLTGWLGDELLESFPCYIVTQRVADALKHAGVTGCTFDDVKLEVAEQFHELYPDRYIPAFRWLRVTGRPLMDDLGMSDEHLLVVSDRALAILGQFPLNECTIRNAERVSF